MPLTDDEVFAPLLRKLSRLATLSEADRQAVRALPLMPKAARAGQMIMRDGERPTQCSVLIEGYACRHKTTSGGGRQILSFQLAGDLLDVQHLLLDQADHNVQLISDATIAWVPRERLRALMREHPVIAEALWRDTLIDASIWREWVLNVGRRDARSRIAHMLCEFAVRREAAGLGSTERFELPMTQEDIADATGLTSIHVNRMLQALSAEGVIARDRRHLHIVDWPRMRRLADFDAAYLHAEAA